jgi:hypothetical protein
LPLLHRTRGRLDRDTAITVMVDPGKTANELRRIVEQVLGNSRRIRFEVGRAATMFARDHALAGRGPTGEPLLLIPRGFRPNRGKEDVALDERAARRALGMAVHRSRSIGRAGTSSSTGVAAWSARTSCAKTSCGSASSRDEVVAILEAEFGTEGSVLGEVHVQRSMARRTALAFGPGIVPHRPRPLTARSVVARDPPVVMLTDPDLGLGVHRSCSGIRGSKPGVGSATCRPTVQADEYRRVAEERRPRLHRYRRSSNGSGIA